MRWITLCILFALAACASAPPPAPPQAFGPIVRANTDEEALAELIRAAKAGLPKQRRFVAERGEDVREILSKWAKSADMKLMWKATSTQTTPGAIDEADIRAATMALAVLLRDQPNPLRVDFPDKKTVAVTDFPKR